jgi:signal transduction histidine kinase
VRPFAELSLKAPSGFEPLSDVSTLSGQDLSEAIDELRQLVRRLQP